MTSASVTPLPEPVGYLSGEPGQDIGGQPTQLVLDRRVGVTRHHREQHQVLDTQKVPVPLDLLPNVVGGADQPDLLVD
jgi:hypothetical protein